MSGCIVGWAHSKFGKHEGRDIESLIVEVAQAALADAGIAAADIDTVYLGTMNGGFVRQEFPASLVFQADPGFRFKPATRVEDACATGSAAIHQGLNAIAAGKARLALIVGVEKMTEISGAEIGDILLGQVNDFLPMSRRFAPTFDALQEGAPVLTHQLTTGRGRERAPR